MNFPVSVRFGEVGIRLNALTVRIAHGKILHKKMMGLLCTFTSEVQAWKAT